jgi:hypothetical protein
VLVTSDIAAEGVNLHKQCHHLIHVDLPWSLITLEQRNGRIDRYGQLHSPEIRYLVYQPADEEVASDMRIVSKLIAKEHAAHRALGDVGSVMGLYSESEEEDHVRDALRKRTAAERERALEEAAPEPAGFDPWAFAGLGRPGQEESTAPPVPPAVPVDAPLSLFEGDDDYLTSAVRLTYPSPAKDVAWETDGPVISFKPPDDLLRRLGGLPQSYLRQRNLGERLRLTARSESANRSLVDAVNQREVKEESGTAWPEIHHLGPQHPVLEWIADKVLFRLKRDEAITLACDVSEPVLLVSGVWSNKLGEPIAADWLAATVEDGLVTFEDMHAALGRAGVRAGMVNPHWTGDLSTLQELAPPVVNAAISRLTDDLQDQLVPINRRLDATRGRLEAWQSRARGFAGETKSDAHRHQRINYIDRVTKQITSLIADHTPADAPLVRIVGALVPSRPDRI